MSDSTAARRSVSARRLFALTVLALLLAGATTAAAQGVLDRYPKNALKDVPDKYRRWVRAEVGHIITDNEFEVFLRLDSEAKYEGFLEGFWKVRDVTPGTPRNEYRELHYERLAHANKFLGRGTSREGWETDKGRIWILLGEPLSQNRINSDMLIYPVEIWMYAGNSQLELPPFFWVVFYKRFNTGEYRLYSPLSDGPERLLNGAGEMELDRRAQSRQMYDTFAPTGFGDMTYLYSIFREIDIDLAGAAFTLFPSEQGLSFGLSPLRSELLLAQIAGLPDLMMPDNTWAMKVLTGTTESDVRFETLDMDATAIGLIDTDGQPFIHFATQTRGQNLNMLEYEDRYYFSFDASGSLTTPDLKVLRNFDANMSGELDTEQARRFNSQPFVYLDILPALPGHQTLTITLENKVARTFGVTTFDLDVPRAHPDRPTLVGPVLAAGAQTVPQYDRFAQRYAFQYADLAMVPSVSGSFVAGQPIMVFQQALLPAGHTGALTGRYELRSAAGRVVREGAQEFTSDQADVHGVIPHLWNVGTDGLPTGEYTLEISLDGEQQAGLRRSVTIRQAGSVSGRPFLNAQPAPPATDVSVAMDRAEQYRLAGDLQPAVQIVREALGRDPENDRLRALHIQLLEAAGYWKELVEVLTPVVVDNPRDIDRMVQLARAHAEAGEHYDAIRYYERSRIARGEDSPEILNVLASEYIAEGKADKAKQILELSLKIDADQPDVRAMLERISQPVAEPAQ